MKQTDHDTNLDLVVHAETGRLLEQRNRRLSQLAMLYSEWETAVTNERENLLAQYQCGLGQYELACLKREVGCARIKREIELILSAIQRRTAWDYQEIVERLDQEFREWELKVEIEHQRVRAGIERLSNLVESKDSKKLRQLYRQLVKELHPDICPERHPRCRPLWDRLQFGYRNGCLQTLELVADFLSNEAPDNPPSSLELLRTEIELLTKKCQHLVQRLSDLRKTFPFDLQTLLDHPEALDRRREELQVREETLRQREEGLRQQLNSLLDLTR